MARFALCALALFLLAAPAAAQNEGKWGAIAYGGPDKAWGAAVDHPSADAARRAALEACGGRCAATLAFLRSCAAVAENPAGGLGLASNRWRARAIGYALTRCARTGADCTLLAWACTAH